MKMFCAYRDYQHVLCQGISPKNQRHVAPDKSTTVTPATTTATIKTKSATSAATCKWTAKAKRRLVRALKEQRHVMRTVVRLLKKFARRCNKSDEKYNNGLIRWRLLI